MDTIEQRIKAAIEIGSADSTTVAGWLRAVERAGLRVVEADKGEVVAWQYRWPLNGRDGMSEWSDISKSLYSNIVKDQTRGLYAGYEVRRLTPLSPVSAAGMAAPPSFHEVALQKRCANLETVLREVRRALDPECDPTRLSFKELLKQVNRVLSPAVAAPPAASADAVREQIARIINPQLYERWDRKRETDPQADKWFEAMHPDQLAKARATADAILALPALTAPVAGADAGRRERAALTPDMLEWANSDLEGYLLHANAMLDKAGVPAQFRRIDKTEMALAMQARALPLSPEATCCGYPNAIDNGTDGPSPECCGNFVSAPVMPGHAEMMYAAECERAKRS